MKQKRLAQLNHHEPESAELRASRRCAQICRQSKSSFLASFALLDSARPGDMCIICLCESPMTWGTMLGLPHSAAQLQELRAQLWQHCDAQIATSLSFPQPTDPEHRPFENGATNLSTLDHRPLDFTSLWPALSNCVQRYQIPVQLLDDIIAGVSMDVQHRQPTDWNELRHYCYHVAAAVGLACTHIWRNAERTSEIPTQAASDCGFAFQLTNILRDIGEDARAGRIYIPQAMFDEYSVDRDAWLTCQPSGNWQAMLEEIAEHANKLYLAGWPTIHILSPQQAHVFANMAQLPRIAANPDDQQGTPVDHAKTPTPQNTATGNVDHTRTRPAPHVDSLRVRSRRSYESVVDEVTSPRHPREDPSHSLARMVKSIHETINICLPSRLRPTQQSAPPSSSEVAWQVSLPL
ncbi:MAG: phytoene/squalene synthase family protein [Pirellulaceae bacterium]